MIRTTRAKINWKFIKSKIKTKRPPIIRNLRLSSEEVFIKVLDKF